MRLFFIAGDIMLSIYKPNRNVIGVLEYKQTLLYFMGVPVKCPVNVRVSIFLFHP